MYPERMLETWVVRGVGDSSGTVLLELAKKGSALAGLRVGAAQRRTFVQREQVDFSSCCKPTPTSRASCRPPKSRRYLTKNMNKFQHVNRVFDQVQPGWPWLDSQCVREYSHVEGSRCPTRRDIHRRDALHSDDAQSCQHEDPTRQHFSELATVDAARSARWPRDCRYEPAGATLTPESHFGPTFEQRHHHDRDIFAAIALSVPIRDQTHYVATTVPGQK